MKMNRLFALAALAASPAISLAGPVLLDFETPTSFYSIGNYYNGGADGAGAIGPKLAVTFGLDALALQNDALGPYFANAPTPIGVMTPVGPDATMNVFVGGFSDISFYYSSSAPVTVNIWSDINGKGTLLDTVNLTNNALGNNCSNSSAAPYCNFDMVSLHVGGVGRSVTFGSAENVAVFDNIVLRELPEPSTALLFALGLPGLLATARRRGFSNA